METSNKILVKIGSNVLTLASGLPDKQRIAHIVDQIADLKSKGFEVILVSSGAVAAGRSVVGTSASNLNKVSQKQVLASIGQIQLMNIYSEQFEKHNLLCSQVLVAKESFRTRAHYLNIKNCLESLLKSNITPIINENDVVSIAELMFTDNDELSGLVASMMDVKHLVLLSNVDGIFTAHPSEPGAELIKEFTEAAVDLEEAVSDTKSEFGRGGMLTKANTAKKIAHLGVNVYIGNGEKNNIIKALLNKETGTFFKAETKEISSIKKWISQSGGFSGASIVVNEGAKAALLSDKTASILPVGVTEINGTFQKGDVIDIFDSNNNAIGLGKVAYDSEEALNYIGERDHVPIIHYNFLVLN